MAPRNVRAMWLWGVIYTVALAAWIPLGVQAQQTGRVVGTVTDAQTGQPLAAVQVFVEGASGTVGGPDGGFAIENVPAGTHSVVAQRLGYTPARQQEVTVTAGATTTVNLTMAPQALALEGIVATGLVDPVEGVRAPIAVARVTRELMPVTVSGSSSAVENLTGRVAGVRINRGDGGPGDNVTIMLRSPTSLRGGGSPLMVVDGVILSGEGVPATVDIESMDVESIEVIRGAAAASLYGSRAAAGVISITTARGQGLSIGQTRFTARTEYGRSENLRNVELNDSHFYYMNANQTEYTLADEVTVVDRENRDGPSNRSRQFLDNPYPGQLYDNIGAITQSGQYLSQNFQVTGNSAETNFSLSLAHSDDQGSLVGSSGYRRSSLRLNLDHRFMDNLSVGVSFFNSRDRRDLSGTGAFDNVLNAPRDVDFSERDADGNLVQNPGGYGVENPLWDAQFNSDMRRGSRTLANMTMNFTPTSWLRLSGNVGYDRADSHSRDYTPKGTPGPIGAEDDLSDGSITFNDDLNQAWNAEGSVTLMRDFGQLNVRTTVRGIMESDEEQEGERSSSDFILFGVPQIENTPPDQRDAESSEQTIRSQGYLWDTALDYAGKYIVSVLGRRDESSLFGPANRTHYYYRVAGAWRLSEEDWFNVDLINELKISMARGTAGGRPNFNRQYETWEPEGGIPTKTQLGNRELAPEKTTEHEVSLNMVLADRFGIVLTHAWQSTEGQINPGPLPAVTGYSSQWVNAGTISGHSTELEFEAQLISNQNVNWTSMVVADYSNAKISEWNIPCYAQSWRWNCVDIPVYGIYSRWLLKDLESLNQHHGGALLPYADQFEVNDEGFLVWVGEGNHYWEGVGPNGIAGDDDDLWGTSIEIEGVEYGWGNPFYERLELGGAHRTLLGEGAPSNFGWINNVQWGGFTFNAALHASIGGQTNNRHFQNMMRNERLTSPELNQAGKPEELKKPVSYYRAAVDGDNSYTIEDSSYLKLRQLSVSYNMNQNTLARFGMGNLGLEAVRLGLIVRNVFTLTHYDGFDPEGGFDLNSLASSDSSNYPPLRTLTAELELTF